MADTWQLKAIISAADRISPTLKHIQRNFRGLHKSAMDMASATRGLVTTTGMIIAPVVAGALAAGRSMLGTAASFEKFETVLEAIEGSSDKAKTAMGWISDFATKTPYELGDVTDAFVKLRAYGMDPVANGLLTTLGDTASAMGKPLIQSVEAIADALTGENERLKEFGIKAKKAGQWLVYEYSAAGKTMKARAKADSREHIQATLQAIWNQKYAGSMDKLSRTWGGTLSNLSDQWSRFAQMVMNSGAFTWMKTKLAGVLSQIDALSADGTLQKWASEIGGALKNLFAAVVGGETVSARTVLEQFKNGLLDVIRAATTFVTKIQWVKDQVGGWRNLFVGVFLLANASLLTSFLSLTGAVYRFGGALVGLVFRLDIVRNKSTQAVQSIRALGFLPGIHQAVISGLTKLRGLLVALRFSYAIGGLRGLASAVGGGASGVLAKLGGYIGSAARAVLLLGRALMLSPLGIVLTLASAAYLIWKNWDAVSLAVGNFFAKLPYWAGFAVGSVINGLKQLGQMIGDIFARAWQACSAWAAKMGELVCTAVDGMTAYFKTLPQRVWTSIKSLGSLLAKIWHEPYAAIDRFVEAIKAKMMGMVNAVKDIISGISQVFKKLGGEAVSEVMNGYQVGVNGVPSKSSLLSHPAVAQSISARQDLKGEMTVRFEGAPQGMRVEPGRTNHAGMAFNPDVGYRFASVG